MQMHEQVKTDELISIVLFSPFAIAAFVVAFAAAVVAGVGYLAWKSVTPKT